MKMLLPSVLQDIRRLGDIDHITVVRAKCVVHLIYQRG